MTLGQRSPATSLASIKAKVLVEIGKHRVFLAPLLVALYLLFGLLIYVFLQGDLNNFDAFMRTDAVVSLFTLYCVASVAGFGVLVMFKRGLGILSAHKKTVVACFLTTIIVGVSVFSFLTFTATPTNYEWMHDGLVFQQMAQSFLANHEFIENGGYMHHFGPIFPLYLSPFLAFFPVLLGTQIADELAFLLALIVVFVVTKKMYGVVPALITTALASTFPIYQFAASRNYAEPLVLLMFTLTLYFILESLKPEKENRIIIAGLTAGVGFLTKSSLGYLFIVAAVAGFLWRFYYVRWGAIKNRNYILAVLAFVSVLLVWTARDVWRFWDGSLQNLFVVASQPSSYMSAATSYAFSHLSNLFVVVLIFCTFGLFYIAGCTWFLGDYLRIAFRKIREERVSLLALAVALPFFIGLVITGVYFVYENSIMPVFASYLAPMELRYFMTSFGRYSFIVFVPLSWLAYELANERLQK